MPSGRRPPPRRSTRSGERDRDRDRGRSPARGEGDEPPQARAQRPRQTASDRPQRRQRSAPRRQRSDLLARIAVAVPAAVVAIVFVDVGGILFALFLMGVSFVCLHELYRMLARWRPAPVVGFAAAAGMVLAARLGTDRDVLEVAVAALPVAFLVVIASARGGMATVSIAGTLLGVWWIGIAFAHAELLRQVPHGNSILIDILVGTFLGDTAAYIGGRLFGRRPLAPEISPNKTLEGLFCGMLIAIVAIFIAGLYQTWLTQGDALLLGLVVAVLGPVGDLFESLVKRDAGAKDSGNLFGAHGGALDRLDAVIFTVVGGYYVWIAVIH